MLLLSNLGPD